jgi:serine phosphatase RsbU (regulator of sigma subunit)
VAAEALAAGIHSSLSLPLSDGSDTALGALNLYGAGRSAFSRGAGRSAETYARHAALIVGYLHRLHRERSLRAREHEISATLQRSLLPTLPDLPGIRCAARYLSSDDEAQVGGDWYDVFAMPDGAIGVAIGDVMGHDIEAAAAMGQLRSVLRSYAYEGSRPAVVLDRLDRLVQDFDMAQAATAIYGRLTLDGHGASLRFANAGHLPPVVRHVDGHVTRIEPSTSPLIGVPLPALESRAEGVVALPTGSTLVLYTDGLVESRGRELQRGLESLCDVLAATDPGSGLDGLCDTIVSAMLGAGQDDDVALLAVRIVTSPSRS